MLIEEGALRRENGRWVGCRSLPHRSTGDDPGAACVSTRPARSRSSAPCSSADPSRVRSSIAALSSSCRPEPERPGVDERLSELVVKELIEPEGAEFSTDDAFRFHHLLLRDVAYESVQKDERASLHERFADWLDHQAGERASEYDEIAGYHLEQAVRYQTELRAGGPPERSLAERAGTRLNSAGSRAHARGDWPAAVSLLSRARALLPADAEAQSALVPKLADALIEIAPATPSRLRSLRCFWHWPIGHRWTIKERTGVLAFRCAMCGRERNRGGAEAVLDPYDTERRMVEIEMSQESGGWRGGGWGI